MSEMIERVARALHHAEALSHAAETKYGDLWGWDDLMPPVKERCRAAARAAIEAMREPTEAMIAAAMVETATDLRSEYRAMIDAAISTPDQKGASDGPLP